MFKTNIKNNKGFTLVETLVAISILSLSILATFTAVQSGLAKSSYAKDQITAFFLVQESMEYIRNIRDENALLNIADGGSRNWLDRVAGSPSDPCSTGKTCRLDSYLGQLYDCASDIGGTCLYLNQNSSSMLFGYTSGVGWSQSKFKREIKLDPVVGTSDEVIITVTVTWAEGRVQIKQSLFNIR